MSEQAKLLAAEYVRRILDTGLSGVNYSYFLQELEKAYEAGWKACERKDLPYDAMIEGQDD